MVQLQPGDLAPDFEGIDEQGRPVALRDFRGRKLALFFYPQDNTPTCTAEACSLRDRYSELRKAGIETLGASPDSPRRHLNYAQKHGFPFRLLADENLETIKKYGCWGPKKLFGREYDGVLRTTFLIDETGRIEAVFRKIDAADHARQILDALPK